MGSDDERNLLVFRRDAQGKVNALIERRKFNDLRLARKYQIKRTIDRPDNSRLNRWLQAMKRSL